MRLDARVGVRRGRSRAAAFACPRYSARSVPECCFAREGALVPGDSGLSLVLLGSGAARIGWLPAVPDLECSRGAMPQGLERSASGVVFVTPLGMGSRFRGGGCASCGAAAGGRAELFELGAGS